MICCLFNFLILISHRGESRTPKATKIEIFVSTTNDSQPLTVVTLIVSVMSSVYLNKLLQDDWSINKRFYEKCPLFDL